MQLSVLNSFSAYSEVKPLKRFWVFSAYLLSPG
jgi:hypothetical protein